MSNTFTELLIARSISFYPSSWKTRHGKEAAQLAVALRNDGTSSIAIASSYFFGAMREHLHLVLCRRFGRVAVTALVGLTSIGVPVAILGSSTSAGASNRQGVTAKIHEAKVNTLQLQKTRSSHQLKMYMP